MASQPIISFSEPVYRQYKPTVSFAVIAGEGAQAVNTAVKTLPAHTQAATLDDLAWRDMTANVIALGQKLLSPRMYAAFLRWGEAASHFSTRYETDEEGDARCAANGEAVRSLAATSAANTHDLLLKVYLSSLEAGDCGAFGFLEQATFDSQYLTDRLAHGSADDVVWHSPLPAQLDDLASRARRASPPGLLAIAPEIGGQITAAFADARVQRGNENRFDPAESEHVSWLRQRNDMVGLINGADAKVVDEEAFFEKLHQLERQFDETPAPDATGLFAQLLFAVQIVAEGHELDEGMARKLVQHSIEITGLGYLWSPPAISSEPVA
jgi:hypothetical protein